MAEDGTWYRNATTARSDTELAVPTLATGIKAPMDSLATYGDHPRSLFTLLGSSYEMHVSEPWTNLCPDSLCEGGTESLDEGGLGSILATIPSILGYVSVPDAKRLGISSPRESGAISRPGQFETFVEEIEPAKGPVLHYLHVLLPHKSWKYLPSGERYSDTVGADAELGGLEEWEDDEWDVLQHEQRFFLQLEYTDRLLGELLSKLRGDRPLRALADRRRGGPRRFLPLGRSAPDATETNAPDILSVPLSSRSHASARASRRRPRADRSTSCRRSPTRSAPRCRGRWTGCRLFGELLRIARSRSRTCVAASLS